MKPARKTTPAEHIREECRERGWNGHDLAEQSGIRLNRAYAILHFTDSDTGNPSRSEWMKVAKAFGISDECAVKLYTEVEE